ncbi:MAG TPA: glycosyltransferase [Candidatus Binataceae bacterium]|nr:glycosyltransferase [Candidatus Binataceae bacterium]
MKLSVIIATQRRPESLAKLLASIAPQVDSDTEVIVAENGTPEPAQLPAGLPPLMHLHEPLPGKCRVQNRAIEVARGEVLVFLDDDLIVAPRYLEAVRAFFDSRHEFAAMAGRVLPGENPELKAGALAPYLDLPIVDRGDLIVEVRGVIGANMAFREAVFREVGRFDERLGPGAGGHEEETEMSARLRRAGYLIGYAPRALVYHEVDLSRADRDRFLRVARERGRCRMLHESHSRFEVISKYAIARTRLWIAQALRLPLTRVAREERRLAVAEGMRDGLAAQLKESSKAFNCAP